MERNDLPYIIADLIFRSFEGRLSPEEQRRLDDWVAEDPQHAALLDSFRHPERLEADLAFFDQLDVDADWEAVAVRSGYDSAGKTRRRWTGWAAAAAVLAIGVTAWWMWPSPARQTPLAKQDAFAIPEPGGNKAVLQLGNGRTVSLDDLASDTTLQEGGSRVSGGGGQLVYDDQASGDAVTYNTLRTPNGGQYTLTLSDGTVVSLNASSSIRFPTRFTGDQRKVELEGEGFFEVAKGTRPFLVSVNGTEVLVLGTQFNIMGYHGVTKTTLTEGAVQVRREGETPRRLKPGQQATVTPGQDMTVEQADLEKALAWKNGLFCFRDDSMSDILDQVGRWYDADVTVGGTLPSRKFSGIIRRQARLTEVLDMLEAVSGAECSISGRQVRIQFR
ncbi:FecR family protein [Chitinophaga lutea]